MRTSQDTGLVRLINMIIKSCLVAMMMAIASLTIYQVFMRYGLNKSSSWSEEAIRFIFIWCTFIAVAIGIREKIHIGIDIIVRLFSKTTQSLIELIVYVLISIFSGYLVYYGFKVVLVTQYQTSPALGIPMSWVYLAVPTMGILVIFYSLLETIDLLKTIYKK